ncbi:MAG: hypothetical protein KA165_11325, partial [Saprospiraceae bacterium]|nr:hypothetical protein [Saprospiraceae bacterium]
ANGTVQFAGYAKGTYNDIIYPAFKLDFKVGNADFKYPSLPLGVSNINVDASITSPTQRMNDMKVDIPKFSLRIGSNPLEGYFHLKTPESDPTVDMKINGTLNLGELSKAFPVEGVQELAGIIKANMTIKAAMSQVDKQQYDQVNMAGDFGMSGITYRAAGTPTVVINQLSTSLTPQRVDIQNFDAKLGKSDLRASGSIDNILAYFSTKKTMTGVLNFSSNYFDANEWMEEPAAAQSGGVVPSETAAVPTEKAFDRWDFIVDGKMNRLKYDTYDISDMSMKGHFTPNKMNVSDFGLKMGASDLHGNGEIRNAWNYMFDNQTVAGVVNLSSNYFDLNQFMTEPAAAASTSPATPPPAAEIIPVPENMDMTLNANFGKVKYTTYDLNNLQGKVVVKDAAARLEDFTADAFGGRIGLSGEYNTKNPAKPMFNIDMALQNMGFKESFQNFVTVKSMAPIMQLIDGKFNTTLSMSGLLGKDMTPDMTTLSAAGFLETLNAAFSNFKPLAEIGSKLGIDYLSKMELKNTKNWFEIKDGNVVVKPFNAQVRDVAMQIGGTHGLNKEMSYQIVTKTPRKALEKSAIGSAANSGLNFLSKEAGKYGVNIAQGEFINVRFDLTGSMSSPKVAMKILGSDGQSSIKEETGAVVQATVDKAKDTLRNIANRELDAAKEKAKAAADKAADSLRNLADKKIQEAKDKATKELGDKAGEAAGKKADEVLGDKGKKTVDEAKKKLEGWDPFKKKKKDN